MDKYLSVEAFSGLIKQKLDYLAIMIIVMLGGKGGREAFKTKDTILIMNQFNIW